MSELLGNGRVLLFSFCYVDGVIKIEQAHKVQLRHLHGLVGCESTRAEPRRDGILSHPLVELTDNPKVISLLLKLLKVFVALEKIVACLNVFLGPGGNPRCNEVSEDLHKPALVISIHAFHKVFQNSL